MDSFELNKIIAAVLMTVLLVIGINKIADSIFHVEKPKQSAYKVEGVELALSTETTKEVKEIVQLSIKEILALGDPTHGEKVFKKCSACHIVAKGGKNLIGPALYGVVGRASASIPDYAYSSALKAHGKNWSFEELNAFLLKPKSYIKGTKMAYAGLRKDKDRASVILYLNSKSDSPLPKP
ncbi:cytochrome c family protein [Pelagibacteraceae bacterium]|nr:cytochrome c family protein [Pelagibacteraceae bacterium]